MSILKRQEISDFEIIKGCAEYLQISEADIVSNDYMIEHPDVLNILVNVAINGKKKPFRENKIMHRQLVVHKLSCNDIGYTTRQDAEKRTRERTIKDKSFKSLVKKITKFIIEKDYMVNDFEVINSKIVGYHGKEKDIVIPDGLQLYERAFSGCVTIESITLNKEIKEIPWSAFSNCINLTRMYGLEQVEKIGQNAFYCCENLSEINLPIGIEEIEDHTFYGCTSLKEVTVPENVIEIGYAAFQDCKNLRSIKLPKRLKKIHMEAFMCCNSLEEVEIPDNVELIGDAAFEFCKNLKHISFSSQTLIEKNAFSDTPWETEQVNGGTFVTNGILHKVDERIEEYIIPEDVTKIAMAAFYKSNIKKITIPKNVIYIGAYAFSESQLEEIYFECNECEFDHSLFEYCGNIKEIILPSGMKKIYGNTFGNIDAIVEIPESVEYIYCDAFEPSPLSKATKMKPKIRAKEGTIGAEFAKKHGIELILK